MLWHVRLVCLRLAKLFLAPGNAGSHLLGERLSCSPTDFEGLAQVVKQQNIDFICVGLNSH